MRERPQRSWVTGGEVGLADVAMAILGPTVFLMIIFMAAAAAVKPECDRLNPNEIERTAKQLETWQHRAADEIADLEVRLARSCLNQKPSAEALPDLDLPPALAGVCRTERIEVLRKAGISENGIEPQQRKLAQLRSAMLACVPDCTQYRALADADRRSLIALVRQWRGRLETEAKSDQQLLRDKKCGNSDARQQSAPLVIEPALGRNVCPDFEADLLRDAGIDREALAKVLTTRASFEGSLRSCVEADSCRRPEERRRADLVRATRDWYGKVKSQIETDEGLAKERCAAPASVDSLLPFPLDVTPLRAADLCADSRAQILREAGISGGDLDTLAKRQAGVVARLRECANKEQTSTTSRAIGFMTCSVAYANPDNDKEEMSKELAATKLNDLADKIIEKIDATSVNRVDVIGHSDARTAKNCDRARNNAELSSLRAHKFVEDLINTLRQRNDDKARKIVERYRSGELKFYAIGVGEFEPIIKDAKEEKEFKCNRRIEFRYTNAPIKDNSASAEARSCQ